MRKMQMLLMALLSLLPAALFAQTCTLPEQLNRMTNPAHDQQRANAVAPFGQSDVFGFNGALVNYGGSDFQ